MFITFINFINDHSPLLYLTQSLWRDEAFSVLMSEPPIFKIIDLASQDFNPPLYYLILHFWMRIFGQGEVAIRTLSFIFHLLLVYLIYQFAKLTIWRSKSSDRSALGRSRSYYLLLFTFLNPMLIYFAFEARMYSLLALLATASMYFFLTKNWVPYVLASTLGLWTQPFMAFVLLSQIFYLVLTRSLTKKHILSLISIFLLFSPWLPVILFQLTRSGPMWIWPINATTVTTILGNLFTGYEGTPWDLWNKMKILSGVIFLTSFLVFRETTKVRGRQHSDFCRLLLSWLFLPVILVLAISYFKPIYVNRYLIFVTVAEIFVIVSGISLIKYKIVRRLFAFCFLLFAIFFNVWFPSRHKKLDLKLTLAEINKLAGPGDFVYSQTPLTFFEATYYTSDRSRVLLYNPNQTAVPLYVGANLITKDKMIYNFPKLPSRAFLIYDDGKFEVVSQR